MKNDPTFVLLSTNHWANENILESCRALTGEQFHQRFEMGLGSLHDSMLHILSAMKGWGDLLAQREQGERMSGDHSIDQMLDLNTKLTSDLEDSAKNHPNDELVTGERGGRSFTFARGAVLTHVTTHGMHHRAQCLNMLRHLDVETQPQSSVVEWMLAGNSVD